jgi:hypothetical protein
MDGIEFTLKPNSAEVLLRGYLGSKELREMENG